MKTRFLLCCAELRLVVLGERSAGRRPAVCSILGQEDHQQDHQQDTEEGEDLERCSRLRGEAAGRQVWSEHMSRLSAR